MPLGDITKSLRERMVSLPYATMDVIQIDDVRPGIVNDGARAWRAIDDLGASDY